MKKIITLFIALISISMFSQKTITKEVGDFSELKVYDLIEINLIQSSENKVVIKGKNTSSVKVINQNGKLKLRMPIEERFDGSQTFIEVYFKNIDIIDANEGAVIVANNLIEQNTIELRSQEGAKIKVGLKVNHAAIKAVSGGIIEASGLSTSQVISINSGGIFEGRELKTQDTKIGITAAGEADIFASDKVDVKVTAGGNVSIYGNPKNITEKKVAGGRITIKN